MIRKVFGCGGVSLQKVVKFIAAFEMAICVIAIIPVTLVMLDVCFEGDIGVFLEFVVGVPRVIQLSIWLAFWIVIIMKFVLEVNLYRSASNKIYETSLIWLTITGGVLISCYVWSVLSLNMFWTKHGCLIVAGANLIVGMYKGFEMVIVYKFMQSLKKANELQLFTTRATALAPISITEFNFDKTQFSKGVQLNTEEDEVSLPKCKNCHMKFSTQNEGFIRMSGYKVI